MIHVLYQVADSKEEALYSCHIKLKNGLLFYIRDPIFYNCSPYLSDDKTFQMFFPSKWSDWREYISNRT